MLGFSGAEKYNSTSILNALSRSLAIIEFDPTGTIITANENFCRAVGYNLSEIQGKHHSIFVAADYARSAEYKAFWTKLGSGEFDAGEYKRFGKNGREIWIQASYNPVKSKKGAILKVVKVATVITDEKLRNADFEGKLRAISLVQAVIEFTTDGEIIDANENFLSVTGYRLDEIKGRHHRLFVEPVYAGSSDYRDFWTKLNRGEYISASFKRIGKAGKEVWIQASYNPILDMNGRVIKVVKYASDITDLTEIGSGLARVAANDFGQRIDRAFMPAFEQLRIDFNLAHDNLRSTLIGIAEGASFIQSGTRDISTAADDLARRTEHQAASLEETAAALDQITATVRKSAQGADHARRVVGAADQDAKTSAVVVRQAIDAMDAIAKSAQQIGQIIGVIDEIAFQTNLLALNAGVEAARAGDAGRGFAVVASEVRALAQRSAEAAKEIKGLISSSSAQVDRGVKLVAETGQSLGRILVQVGDINSVIIDIAAGAREQAIGLDQVNTAINEMDKVTQQNAAMVEQSRAASHSLSLETEKLSDLVGRFEVGRAGAASSRAQSERPAPHKLKGATMIRPSSRSQARSVAG